MLSMALFFRYTGGSELLRSRIEAGASQVGERAATVKCVGDALRQRPLALVVERPTAAPATPAAASALTVWRLRRQLGIETGGQEVGVFLLRLDAVLISTVSRIRCLGDRRCSKGSTHGLEN
jgi:hypothetical protein